MDRFWPSLIDRLDLPSEDALPIDQHFVDPQTLRERIKESLERLLNTIHLEATEPLDGFDHVRRSVLNYGVPELTGRTAAAHDAAQLQRRLREAIAAFEPRVHPDTLRVEVVHQSEEGRPEPDRPLELLIQADLLGDPAPERVILRTMMGIDGAGATVRVE